MNDEIFPVDSQEIKTKVCSGCKTIKNITEFSKNKSQKDGLANHCKCCNKEYRLKNKDKLSEYFKKYYIDNIEELKVSKLVNSKKWYIENKEKVSEKSKQYYISNFDKIKERRKLRSSEIKLKLKEYRLLNKDKICAKNAEMRAIRRKARPIWLNENQVEEIKDFYTIAKMFQIYTGLTYHVDHMIPLCHPLVCGLHVPWNLQILEASENLSKKNKLLEEFEYAIC